MNGNELANAMTDAVNSGIDPTELQGNLQGSHNTLQRYTFDQVLKPAIIALAETPYVDPRNERVVERSREICDEMNWEY